MLHVPNHALKDVYMFNYGIMKNTNRPYYTRFFVIIISYNLIKTDSLGFLHIPYYFWTITWIKEANNFQKAKVQPKGVRFCFFSQPGVAYKHSHKKQIVWKHEHVLIEIFMLCWNLPNGRKHRGWLQKKHCFPWRK